MASPVLNTHKWVYLPLVSTRLSVILCLKRYEVSGRLNQRAGSSFCSSVICHREFSLLLLSYGMKCYLFPVLKAVVQVGDACSVNSF